MFEFAFTLKPDMTPDHIIALTRQAESAGFNYGWIFDSHVLWLEPYPMLTLMATNTKKMKLGTCVTNPATRDITVNGVWTTNEWDFTTAGAGAAPSVPAVPASGPAAPAGYHSRWLSESAFPTLRIGQERVHIGTRKRACHPSPSYSSGLGVP